MIYTKLLFGHFIISIISILAMAGIIEVLNERCSNMVACNFTLINIIWIVLLIIFLCAYVLNGYVSTKNKEVWYKYYSVAFIGILFWMICFAVAPKSTNYKSGEGDIWFLYEFFIVAKSPTNFILDSDEKYSLSFDLFQKFIFPILFSSFQYLGGRLKMRRITNSNAS
ncbi:hypothetical protein [Flavobacterium caeni]|uniref:Uncharacterized protein n=1 Tax=Flavobacterium caeni TaxID=490189 RepID=A0A1G5KBL3_9FLAO|nr:hypothetical protein [Flavobacterium caeni]SCY97982.1 hypothetical protein SAMN02927903_03219 [Flavobacterium caeni]